MGILDSILKGFGWGVGRELAKKAVDEAGDRVYDEAEQVRRRVVEARDAHARQRAERKQREEQARAARQQEAAIEDELEALKKRVGQK